VFFKMLYGGDGGSRTRVLSTLIIKLFTAIYF
jgi:hypothetical protein